MEQLSPFARIQTANQDFSPEGKMIVQRLVFTRDFLTERYIDRLSEERKFLVATEIQRGIVFLVRNPG